MPQSHDDRQAPPEWIEALESDAVASARYAAMSPSHRREWADYVGGAKQTETRRRRAAKAVAALRNPTN